MNKTTTRGLMAAMMIGLLMPAVSQAADDAAPMTVQVLEVSGRVQQRPNLDADWQPLTAQTKLNVGSEIRTGLRSMAQVQVGPNSVITLKGLGIVAIAELAHDENADVMHTRLAKKYGRLIAEVHQVGETRNDYKISTPGSVLAVRGSGIMHIGYDTQQMHGLSGNVNYQNAQGNNDYTGGDSGTGNMPNPSQYSEYETDRTNTSTPGTDNNVAGNNPNAGYFGTSTGSTSTGMRQMTTGGVISRDPTGSGANP